LFNMRWQYIMSLFIWGYFPTYLFHRLEK
jgi:hypothetical protein